MARTTKKSPSAKHGTGAVAKKTSKKTTGKKTASKKTTGKKTTAKKGPAAAKKTTARKTTTAKKAAGKRKAVAKRPGADAAGRTRSAVRRISAVQRHQLIAEAAYLRSEAQGFFGDAHQDWLIAEAEVDARLSKAGIVVDG